jgi:hypothetical protein
VNLDELSPEARRAAYLKTVATLWRRGNLRFKLDETQLKIREALDSSPERKFFLLCSRRLGKSFMLLCRAFEVCLQNPGARVLFLAPWAKDARDIATDIATQILDDCPEDVRPEYKAQDKEFVFKHVGRGDSVLRLRGVNGETAESLRGPGANLIIADECGQMDNLRHVISSVAMPMLMTTGGRIILATTPPTSPGHDSVLVYEDLASRNAAVKFTILDNPRVSDLVKGEFLREAGERPDEVQDILARKRPPRTTAARREYFCEFVTDASLAVLPEWTKEVQAELVVARERPPHYDAYVSMDPGMQDRTGLLFAYWDFRRGRLVVEDESLLPGPNTTRIAQEITTREKALWPNKEPYLRISDVDLRLIADLWDRSRLRFVQAQKQDSLGAINLVRTMIQARELEVHPRCKHLVRQMENAIWNTKATDFARSQEGHFDLVAALKYLCRHVNKHHNPYPANYGIPTGPSIFRSPRGRFAAEKRRLGLLPDTATSRKLTGGGK